MSNYNIERDLLKTLKSKNEDEVFYVLLNMINGTYQYEITYLNKVPLNELLIHLEKIIVIVTKRKSNTLDGVLNIISDFCKKLPKVKYSDLTKNKALNMKYALEIQLERLKKGKKRIVQVASLMMATTILINLIGKNFKAAYLSQEELSASSISDELDISKENKEIIYEFESNLVHFQSAPPKKVNEILEKATEEQEVVEEVTITNEEKVQVILEKYNLTQEQFRVLCAIVLREAAALSYEDAYAVINTIYNRTLSKLFHIDCERFFEDGSGYSLYYQAIVPGQFIVYEEGYYKEKLDVIDEPGYQAIIDFLYTEEIKHDFLQFRASFCEVEGSTQFVENGNKYFDVLELDERIDKDQTR